jgi:hypothetical protein
MFKTSVLCFCTPIQGFNMGFVINQLGAHLPQKTFAMAENSAPACSLRGGNEETADG